MSNYNNIDRDFLISHLYDIRALELAKHKLSQQIKDNTRVINTLGFKSNIIKPTIISKVLFGFVITLSFVIVLSVMMGITVFLNKITEKIHYSSFSDSYEGFYLSSDLNNYGRTYIIPRQPEFNRYIIVTLVIAILFATFVSIIITISSLKKLSQYKKMKEHDKERVENELKRRNWLISNNNQHIEDLNRLNEVLNENYSVNIIPQQFRNIAGICYLYNYLSTSQESFQSALINFNMNKISSNIQKMTELQNDMLIQQYVTNAKLTDVKHQNKAMLKKLENIEQNTELAAKYSAMNEANTRTIAFFEGVEFFKS